MPRARESTSQMGYSQDDKIKSHQRIVDVAATRFRESGTSEPGVAEIMKAAGLTHGGFYKHFDSRDQLVAEAVGAALDAGERQFHTATDGSLLRACEMPRTTTKAFPAFCVSTSVMFGTSAMKSAGL